MDQRTVKLLLLNVSPTHGMVIHVFEHVIEGINPMDLGTYSVTMDNGAILPDFSVEVMQF